MTPTIVTDRLILRAPQVDDFEPLAEIYTGDRARYMGGPFSRVDAWRFWSSAAGSWLLHGFGYWTAERRKTGDIVGSVGLIKPIGYPERELGWEVRAEHEGEGFAYEAAKAVLDYTFRELGWSTVVSYIHPENVRSIALAERLGAMRDADAPRVDPEDLVYRHSAPLDGDQS